MRPTIRRIMLIICFAMILFKIFHGETSASALSLQQYRSRIQRNIEHLQRSREALQPHEASWLKEQFPPGLLVLEPEGKGIQVDQADLVRWTQEAQGSFEGKKRLVDYLEALNDQISRSHTDPLTQGHSWTQSKHVLDEVYGNPEFQYLEAWKAPFWAEFVDKALRALKRWLGTVLPALDEVQWEWVEIVAYGIILLLGAVLIVWIIRSIRPFSFKRPIRAAIKGAATPGPDLDWKAWRERAQEKADEGAFREAIRCLFLSVLMEGHRRGWWVYAPQATNREHLARLGGHPHRREVFQRLMSLYERAWYGMSRPGRGQFSTCQELLKQLEAIV